MIEVVLVAMFDAAYATRRTQAAIQADVDTNTAKDYHVVAADGFFVYLQRESISAEQN